MTTTDAKAAERAPERPAKQRSLRISWRVLGNRHLRFGEAALKDIGTNGLALQVDQSLRAKEPWSSCSSEQRRVTIVPSPCCCKPSGPANQAADEGRDAPAYLVGCSFTSPLTEKELQAAAGGGQESSGCAAAPPPEAPAKTPAQLDPFLVGSAGEKRSQLRRGGVTVPVVVCRAVGGKPVAALVVDRSMKGLGLLMPVPFTRGTLLKVRPRDAHEKIPSVQVEVRNCRQKGNQWLVGCHFLHPPSVDVLMLLG